jgi:hypothetical protein
MYFDESGEHPGSPVLCVGGFIARTEQWRAFEAEWGAFLDDYRIPRAEYHAKKCGDGKLNLQLAQLINKHTLHGIATSVVRSDYNRETSERWKSTMGGPYAFCAAGCVYHITDWIRYESGEPDSQVAYLFEHGHAELSNTLKQVAELVDRPTWRNQIASVGSVTKAALPCHAADLLTHERVSRYPAIDGPVLEEFRRKPVRLDHLEPEIVHMLTDAVGKGMKWPRLGYSRGRASERKR